ncbi:MAG TPA: hypothetical protein VH370_17975 [Humisphaera sp.]|jgi:hypothetical protein|nr:hypothetical protein [Humisphaera sp.]
MELLPADQFLPWARTMGIILDPVYSTPKCLVYQSDATERRWWNTPADPEEITRFLSHLLNGLGPWRFCSVWRRGGSWPNLDPPRNRLEASRRLVEIGPAIPHGFAGAVKYTADELSHLVGRVAAHVKSGWCVQDDLFIIPDDGQHILQTDHHGVVHVSCLDGTSMKRLIEHMANTGYSLPTEPLDWTFKWPSWMA